MVEHPQVASPPPAAAPAKKSGRNSPSVAGSSSLDNLLDGPYALAFVLTVAALLASLNVIGAFRSDEVWSLNTVGKTFAQMMGELRGDIHPPLYYWLLFPWVRIVGTGEFALRSLSGLLYLASVFALYRWGKQLGGGRVGTIAASVYLTSPLAILASHMARMYALLSLVSILSTWLYWRVFVDGEPVDGARTTSKRTRRNLLLFAIVNALGTLTHIWFFFLLFAEGVHWLILKRAMWRRDFMAFAAVMVASVAPYSVLWLPTLLHQLGKSQEAAAWLLPPTFDDVGIMSFVYAGVVILLLPPAIWQAVKRRVRPYQWANGFTLMLVTAIAVPFAISYIKPVFYSRFTIVGLHLFALVVAASVTRVSNWQLPAFVSGIALASSVYVALQPGTCDARWGAEFLARQASAADSVVFTSLSRAPVDHYLHQLSNAPEFSETSFPAEIDAHPGYEGSLFASGRDVLLKKEAEELASRLRQRHGRVYFFHGFHPEIDALFESALDRQFKRADSKSVTCNGMPCYYNAITVYE
jgi:mannosyltransferase